MPKNRPGGGRVFMCSGGEHMFADWLQARTDNDNALIAATCVFCRFFPTFTVSTYFIITSRMWAIDMTFVDALVKISP